jgi:hypothetical protein
MLQEGLKEKDIPGRTTIHNHIEEMQENHLQNLENEMKVRN